MDWWLGYYEGMDENFINNLRSALSGSGYSADGQYSESRNTQGLEKYNLQEYDRRLDELKEERQKIFDGAKAFSAIYSPLQAIGLGATLAGAPLAGAPVAGATTLADAGVWLAALGRNDQIIEEENELKDRRQKEHSKNMRSDKLSAIDQLMGTSNGEGASILAENGMMVLDDGTIENIDYDYYRPFVEKGEDMSDIFGTRGWQAVKEEARRRGY